MPTLNKHFPSLIVETLKVIVKRVEAEFVNHNLPITFIEFVCLRYIDSNTEPVSQQDCANFLCKDKAAILRTIDLLEIKLFIKRVSKSGDRRVNLLSITTKGKKAFAKAKKIDDEFLKAIETQIIKADMDVFKKVLVQLQSFVIK